MNDYLASLIPGGDTIGVIKVTHKTCPIHGDYEEKVYGYMEGSVPHVIDTRGCYPCKLEADRKADMALDAAILSEARSKELAASVGIPVRFHGVSFDTYIAPDRSMVEALDTCRRFAEGSIHNSGLLLCGPTERGKSHLIYAILKRAHQRGLTAMFSNEMDIYREVKETYLGRKDCMTERQVIAKYAGVDYLGIDEIGRAAWTEHESRILSEIIMKRSDNMKKTILASNMTPEKVLAYFDSATERKLDALKVVASWPRYSDMEVAV